MDRANKYRLGLYEKSMPNTLTWKEKLLCAKECGFDYIEISVDESDEKQARLEWSKEERKELADRSCGSPQRPYRRTFPEYHRPQQREAEH